MLIGHSHIHAVLKEAFSKGNLHHAQLFVGPKFVGKSALALEFCLEIQGVKGSGMEENLLKNGLDPDSLFFWDDGENFSIEAVRALVERANQSHSRPFLVVLIENVGRLRVEAQNALLKTVEESGDGVKFFLTAHQEGDVLPTLISRCQVRRFQRVPDEEMVEAFQGVDSHLLRLAAGRPGVAIRLQENPLIFDQLKAWQRRFESFLNQPDAATALTLARELEEEEQAELILDSLLNTTRRWTHEEPSIWKAQILEHFLMTLQDLRSNVQAKLSLESLFLSFVCSQ